MFSIFNFFTKKKANNTVNGTLSYIPGSQTPGQDAPITLENGELVKRMYIQPDSTNKSDHSSIPIYTGNPFRALNASITSLHQL